MVPEPGAGTEDFWSPLACPWGLDLSMQSDSGCWFHPCAHKPAHVLWVYPQPWAIVMAGDQGLCKFTVGAENREI